MPGVFILSLDTEIAWGSYTQKEIDIRSPIFDDYRDLVTELIALLDAYRVPATWAVVGHLFLEPGAEPPPVLQPHYQWSDRPDWERAPDPSHPDWYHAPDVISAIRGANEPHELATHTFTHVIAGDPAVSERMWASQLAACAATHREHGLALRSLVFPWNVVAYPESLSEHGLMTYRGTERNWYRGLRGPLARLCHLLDRALAFPPPTYAPSDLQAKNRVVELPASQFLMAYDGIRHFVPTRSRIRQAQRGLERAVRHDHIYHLWFHPFNLGTSPAMFEALERILQMVTEYRDRHGLRVLTMAQAGAQILDDSAHA